MDLTNWMGTVAGTLTTIAFVPQVIKTWRSKSAEDISLFMFILFSSGVFFWLLYGVFLGATPIIITNAITLGLALSILYLKIRFILSRKRQMVSASSRGL